MAIEKFNLPPNALQIQITVIGHAKFHPTFTRAENVLSQLTFTDFGLSRVNIHAIIHLFHISIY